MIGYATIGTNDPARALAFWDVFMAELGAKRLIEMPDARQMTFYGTDRKTPMLAVTRPWDGSQAAPGNGNMVALPMRSREQVNAMHAKAIELGATDDGAPGFRGPESLDFYFAYFRDPDGNKIAVFKLGSA